MQKELEIVKVISETPDSSSITFKVPADLKNQLKFKPGQYLTFVINISGQKVKRSYSISSCPFTEDNITVAVKRVKNGVVSNYINDNFKIGDKILVEGPAGNFKIDAGGFFKFNSYVFFAGGSGITPIISMIKAVLAKERFSKVILFYANRDLNSVIYNSNLQELVSKYGNKLNIHYIFDSPVSKIKSYAGILDETNCRNIIKDTAINISKSHFYICGPKPLMDNVKNFLTNAGVPKNRINLEFFSSPTSTTENDDKVQKAVNADPVNVVALVDGSEKRFVLKSGQNLLQAALDANLDVAYSCREGVCSSCKGMLIEGNVKMNESHGLTESEIKKGYILTCQSYPVTKEVKVKFCN